jgi:hypothetical protein
VSGLERGDEIPYTTMQEEDKRLREAWDAFHAEQRRFVQSCETFDRMMHDWQVAKLRGQK